MKRQLLTPPPIRTIAVLLLGLVCVTPAAGQEGFYVGAGFSRTSATGGLDGKHEFTRSDSVSPIGVLLVGKVAPGYGTAVEAGIGFNDRHGIELLWQQSQHTATHDLTPKHSDAEINYRAIAYKFTFNPKEDWIYFGKVGFGVCSVLYDSFGINLNNGHRSGVTLEGGGPIAAGGVERWFGDLGIEAGYLISQTKFIRVRSMGGSGGMDGPINAQIGSFLIVAKYVFRGE